MKTVIEMAETLSHGWWLDDEKLETFADLDAVMKTILRVKP